MTEHIIKTKHIIKSIERYRSELGTYTSENLIHIMQNDLDLNLYGYITHWEQIDIDSEMVNKIYDIKTGFGHEAPTNIKRSGMAISYGMIVFYWCQKTQQAYYLLTQRRDSIPYAIFVRGLYKDTEYLPRYFSLMTNEEKHILKNYTFEEIWNDLHIEPPISKTLKQRAMRTWESIVENGTLDELLNSTTYDVTECDFEFTKGRKMKDEDAFSCAMREFQEEASIDASHIIPLRRETPFIDTFFGSNDKLYQSVYFPGICKRMIMPKVIHNDSLIRKNYVSLECSQIKWVPFSELHNYLDKRKYTLIKNEFQPWVESNMLETGYMKSGIRKHHSLPNKTSHRLLSPNKEYKKFHTSPKVYTRD